MTSLDVRPAARGLASGGAANVGDAHDDEQAKQEDEPDGMDRGLHLGREPPA